MGVAPLVPGLALAGRFEILERAGAGGMGTVYRAVDRADGAAVAVKVLAGTDAAEIERFAREARILATLSHPGIVTFVADGVTPDGARFLVERWVDGPTLAARLEHPGLTVGETVRLGHRLAGALAAAHAAGVVHRDVKPANLILPGGRLEEVTLIDFGVARGAQERGGVTSTGMVVGTPGYMAPEQARGARVDERADLFGLGCVLYECLTGWRAFGGENLVGVRAKVLLVDPEPVERLCPEAPAALVELIRALLAKDPADRPSAVHAAERLAGIGAPPDQQRRPTSGTAAATQTMLPARGTGQSGERAVLYVILIAPGAGAEPAAAPDRAALAVLAEPFGARVEVLADGALACLLAGAGDDDAIRAARCALTLCAHLPGRLVALAAGQGAGVGVSGALATVIDQCADALAAVSFDGLFPDLDGSAAGDVVRLDEPAATLLEPIFDVRRDDAGPYLQPAGGAR